MLNFLLFDSANVGSFSHLAKKKHFARLAKLGSLAAAPSARSSPLPSLPHPTPRLSERGRPKNGLSGIAIGHQEACYQPSANDHRHSRRRQS